MQLNKFNYPLDVRMMLQHLREKGYTEKAIALALKVNQSTVSRLLSGDIRCPKFHMVMKIQTIFQQYA